MKPGLDTNERKRRFHGPQHIAPEAFASAFIDAIQPGGNVEASVEKLKQTVAGLPSAISEPIGGLLADVGEDFVAARAESSAGTRITCRRCRCGTDDRPDTSCSPPGW